MMKFGIGQSVPRREDDRLLKGEGRYTDDLHFENEVVGYAVRSPYAHAEIKSVNAAPAREADGVLLVLTADDLGGSRNELPCAGKVPGKGGKQSAAPVRRVLAAGRVRHVGEAVAFIVAETLQAAKDAADLVEVDYEPLPAVTDAKEALSEGAPLVDEDIPGNLSLDWETGDAAKVEDALRKSKHRVTLELVNNRVVPTAMEPRAAIGFYDEGEGFTLHTPTQGVWGAKGYLASVMGVAPENMKVFTGDVGGGFGMKAFTYPEQVLVLAAAEKLKRPVRWTQERGEAFFADSQGRDVVSKVTLGLDEDLKFTAYHVESIANFGAYHSQYAPYIPTLAALQVLGGVYAIPALYVNVKCALTNTPVVDAYRGAGRPEACYMLERVVNEAARKLDVSQDEIRRRNFIPPSAMPYRAANGAVFDSGNFENNMADAMKNAKWESFAERRRKAEKRGLLRGIGMAYYIECTLGDPTEEVTLEFTDDGKILFYVGTQTNGQGHLTTFSQVIAEHLGVDIEKVELVEGDSTRKASGGGTSGSRSLQMMGNAAVKAADAVIEKGKRLAALVLGADEIEFDGGVFRAKGTNRTIPLLELHEKSMNIKGLPEGLESGLTTTASYTKEAATFPNGCHIAEVEVDPETGVVRVVNYTVVDDFGVVINPLVVEGQVHGGVVQGLGQALTERVVFDADGQIVTGSFMDYGIPRADDIPPIRFSTNEVKCKTNPLGLKGCGEAGTIGACPAVMNALVDALSARGVTHIDMPATPETVWRALHF